MITKIILNNNAILAENEKHEEVIVRGKAIGFKYKKNDLIQQEDVEKIYVLQNETERKSFIQLLQGVPQEYFDVSDKIIQYAKEELNRKLNTYVHVTLTDHIHFAVQRYKEHVNIQNVLLHVIKKFHAKEYKVGEYGLHVISTEFGVDLPEEEAGNIALHIINATTESGDMKQTIMGTKAIKDILNIVKFSFKKPILEDGLNYSRFITHLTFFIQRVIDNKLLVDEEEELYSQIARKHVECLECARKIEAYIRKTFGCEIGTEELVYLTVHINRVTSRE